MASFASAFKRFIADGVPAKNQVPLFRATDRLTPSSDMNVDMRCALLKCVFLALRTLKSLVNISGLSDVERHPAATFALRTKNIIGRFRLEESANGMNLIWICLAGLAGPTMGPPIAR